MFQWIENPFTNRPIKATELEVQTWLENMVVQQGLVCIGAFEHHDKWLFVKIDYVPVWGRPQKSG